MSRIFINNQLLKMTSPKSMFLEPAIRFLCGCVAISKRFKSPWNRFDEVLDVWLPSMEMEQSLVLRETYIDSLTYLIQAMGLACVRWSVKLLSIISQYSTEDHTLEKALRCLLTFIKTTWPKTPSNLHMICLILMKVVIRIYNKRTAINPSENTVKLLKECFHTLQKVSDKECRRLLCDLEANNEMKAFCRRIFEIN